MRECLDTMDVDFIPQHIIGRAIADFYIPSQNKIIEADGDYWHSKPEVRKRDKRRDKWLEAKRYSILRLPESEIKDDPAPSIKRFLGY